MDCRRTLSLALALTTGALGCTHQTGGPVASAQLPPSATTSNDANLGKKQPHASTLVAIGRCSEGAAEEPNRSPAEKERLADQARKSYQQALEIDPKDLSAFTALARIYSKMGDQQRAVNTYRRAIECHPKEASLWYEMGMCHAQQKDWEPALQSLRRAVQLDPENHVYTNCLGFCYARAGRYEESLAAFGKLEGEAVAHYNLARMLHHMNEDELSRQHLRLALDKKPELEPAQDLLAQLERPLTADYMIRQTAAEQPAVTNASSPVLGTAVIPAAAPEPAAPSAAAPAPTVPPAAAPAPTAPPEAPPPTSPAPAKAPAPSAGPAPSTPSDADDVPIDQ